MNKKLTDKPFVTTIADGDKVFVNTNGNPQQVEVATLRASMNENDTQVLNDLAFYIDINQPSEKGASRVDVGGNEHMRQLWENASFPILMDANGNYCELNRNDCRYTAEGEAIVDLTTNALLSKWANCDIMVVIPEYYGRVQEVVIGGQTILRPWFSLVPLPGGYRIPQQVVGKFKANILNGKLGSTPNVVPYSSLNNYLAWQYAQSKSKNHGITNLDYRNYLTFYMMAKYGYRESQICKTEDGTLVWGVGLDGSESTFKEGQTNKFYLQASIRTGSTLSLGMSDGNAPVLDANGDTCHAVNVAGFENPWGISWECVGGLCALGADLYCWRSNVFPSDDVPTAETFAKIEHTRLTLCTKNTKNWTVNIISSKEGQGVYVIANSIKYGITTNSATFPEDYSGEVRAIRMGGASYDGYNCGIMAQLSYFLTHNPASARLAYYGSINKVSPARLAELAVL